MQFKKEFEQIILKPYLPVVQLLKKFMVLAMVALWSLASNHCKLEHLTAFAFLQCGAAETVTAHPEADCDTDGCASLEDGFYKAEEGQAVAVAPVLAEIASCLLTSELTPPVAPKLFRSTPPPPELPQCWQFISRTASPPRAPSFAS